MSRVTVVAIDEGFDGLQWRKPGDVFTMPSDVFKVHDENHDKRVSRYLAAIKANPDSALAAIEPTKGPLWFRKANKEELPGSDLV